MNLFISCSDERKKQLENAREKWKERNSIHTHTDTHSNTAERRKRIFEKKKFGIQCKKSKYLKKIR